MAKAKDEEPQDSTRAVVKRLAKASAARTHISELAQALIGEFGGARGFARECMTVYTECSEAPTQRVAMLKIIANLVQTDTELNGKSMEVDAMVEPEDMDREAVELIQRMKDNQEKLKQ